MKTLNINLGKDLKDITIIPISDVHIGDPNCNLKVFKDVLKEIENTPNMYCVLNGDLCNIALKTSKSDVYSDTMTPGEQIEKLVELLYPIRDKILVIGSGNHEDRIKKETGFDALKQVAERLGVGDKYCDNSWYLFLRFGEKQSGAKRPMCYTISGYHGSGGISPGASVNKAQKMAEIVPADIYVMGHTHKASITPFSTYEVNYGNNSISKKDSVCIVTNSFLNPGGYGEKKGYQPVSIAQTKIELDGTKRKIKTKMEFK